MPSQRRQQEKTQKIRNFADTLRAIRVRRGWTQEQLADFLKVQPSAVGNWESYRNGPHPARIQKIAKQLGVSVDYLTGQALAARFEPPPAPLVLKEELSIAPKSKTRAIPVISFARAGEDSFNYHDLAEFIDEAVQTACTDPNSFALIVEGDSMLPYYMPGDRLIMMPNVPAINGDVVVARLRESGGVLFKLFHQTGSHGETIRLTSYNPAYPPLEYHLSEFRFIYPMYEMYRKGRSSRR